MLNWRKVFFRYCSLDIEKSCNSHCRDTSSDGLSPRGGQASFTSSLEAVAKLVSNDVRGIKDPEEIT